ncbi:MAG: pantoate--beta-alanine ligase [Phycisphaerales bacterium]|nr:MAG: pantoate--beta-alanine ligase [Phycisphaerales bacterium]
MRVVTTAEELREIAGARASVLVPTMGALHEGHAELIMRGAELARRRGLSGGCVVSVFVNPTQFNEAADFERYPRTLEADVKVCERAGASMVFAPGVDEVYPKGASEHTRRLPGVATMPNLEDRFRPGHFAGVCQVVARLFELVRPASAIFGEKDWQQLQVVKGLVRLERLGVVIVASPTVREPDGLAMSSRNRLLTSEDRARAGALNWALRQASMMKEPRRAEQVMAETLSQAGIIAEYAVVRDAASLLEVKVGRPARALIAARLGSVRLIDNAPWSNGG